MSGSAALIRNTRCPSGGSPTIATDDAPYPDFALRVPTMEDAPAYCAFLADREVSIWLEDRCQVPVPLSGVQAYFAEGGFARWAIECQGEFVGLAGLEHHDPARGTAGVFIVIGARRLWGRGLGAAVLCEIVGRGFKDLGLRKINSDILEPNIASLKIHEKAGFVKEGRLRQDAWRAGRWVDRILLSILAEEDEEPA